MFEMICMYVCVKYVEWFYLKRIIPTYYVYIMMFPNVRN